MLSFITNSDQKINGNYDGISANFFYVDLWRFLDITHSTEKETGRNYQKKHICKCSLYAHIP